MKGLIIFAIISYLPFICGISQDPKFEITEGAGWLDSDGQISNYGIEENVESVELCETFCSGNTWPSCVGFTYVSSEKRCDLKKSANAVSLKKDYPKSIISGKIDCPEERRKYDWWSKDRYAYGSGWLNAKAKINTMKEQTADSPQRCEHACEDTYGCSGFTFVASAKRCDLKTGEDAVFLVREYECGVISFERDFASSVRDVERYKEYIKGLNLGVKT